MGISIRVIASKIESVVCSDGEENTCKPELGNQLQ